MEDSKVRLMPDDDDPDAATPLPHEAGPEASAPADRLTEFPRFRRLLFSIAYRMLGSVADAEDILQEAFIRWQRISDADILVNQGIPGNGGEPPLHQSSPVRAGPA